MDTLIALVNAHASELEASYHLILDGAHWRLDASGMREAERGPEGADCVVTLSSAALSALMSKPTKSTVLGLALQRKLHANPPGPAIRLAEQLSEWRTR